TPATGNPTSWYPAPSKPSPDQIEGLRAARCGSTARIGLPVAVLEPASAQQFEPVPSPAPGSESAATPSNRELAETYGATASHARSSTETGRPDGSGMSVARTPVPKRDASPARSSSWSRLFAAS